MIGLYERIEYFSVLFSKIMSTNSRLEKQYYINEIPDELKEDWMFILEVLDGRHKFGYKYYECPVQGDIPEFYTIKNMLEYLLTPMKKGDLREITIHKYVSDTAPYAFFLESIVNRVLKLGIGRSLLPKTNKSPMLAKKFDDVVLKDDVHGYVVTEKLDGNRCIAEYVDDHWEFTSRNGKPMKVNFDGMQYLNTDWIYDGEVLSIEQTLASMQRTGFIRCGKIDKELVFDNGFNSTSGVINSKSNNKHLVYNIFDIISDQPYNIRRRDLGILADELAKTSCYDVRILPALYWATNKEEVVDFIQTGLDIITGSGGEGLMLNLASSLYSNKRTDSLIKIKKTYTMDMKVTGYEFGTGKYEYAIGSIHCEASMGNGFHIECDVGSGLSDEQRETWALRPDDILGKIVEVSYFSLSQDKSILGTNNYSLRFPRLKRVRTDKEETSID